MKVPTSKVVGGRLEIPPGTLREGETVTLVVHDDEESFSITEEERGFLEDSMRQVERGEWVDGWRLLDELET